MQLPTLVEELVDTENVER